MMLNNKKTYLRIDIDYYKVIEQPLTSRDTIKKIVRWSKQVIREDHGNDILSEIPKFDSFCLIPDHDNYQREVHSSYNRYEHIHMEAKKFPKESYAAFYATVLTVFVSLEIIITIFFTHNSSTNL